MARGLTDIVFSKAALRANILGIILNPLTTKALHLIIFMFVVIFIQI
jgi:hypothetical protein